MPMILSSMLKIGCPGDGMQWQMEQLRYGGPAYNYAFDNCTKCHDLPKDRQNNEINVINWPSVDNSQKW